MKKIIIIRLLFLFLVCIGVNLKAQTVWEVFNTQNSPLLSNSIRQVYLDTDQSLWVSTAYGLGHYDGTNWQILTQANGGLPDDIVNCVARDSSGNLWVGTLTSGLGKFDGINWTYFTFANSNIPEDHIRALAIDSSGRKWVATTGGLAVFNDTVWKVYDFTNSLLQTNNIADICFGTQDTAWIGTVNGGLVLMIDTQMVQSFTYSNSGIPDNTILSVKTATDGSLWMASPAGGLIHRIPNSWEQWTNTNSAMPDASCQALATGAGNKKMIGMYDSGLVIFQDSLFYIYDTLNSDLPDNYVRSIVETDLGVIWIATEYGGVAKLTFTTPLGTEPLISTMGGIAISPQPANECLKIDLPTGIKVHSIRIFSSQGQIVSNILPEKAMNLDCSQWQTGVYFLEIVTGNGTIFRKLSICH